MKTLFSLLVIILFGLTSACPNAFAAHDETVPEPPSILFLHSYHKGYPWTDNLTRGFEVNLGLHPPPRIQMEYMDTKRISDPAYLDRLFEIYRFKFQHRRFSLVVTADDNAFLFARKHHDALFPDTPVVFCGLNYYDEHTLMDRSRFTGVVETFDIEKTIETALRNHPETRRIYIINDETRTGLSIRRTLPDVIFRFEQQLEFILMEGDNLRQISEQVRRLPPRSLVLFLVFFRDREGAYYELEESVQVISRTSPVPVYGIWDFCLNHGIMGGMITSAHTQGELAAGLARRILNGETPEEIPVISKDTGRLIFDYNQMLRFNVPLSALPPESTVINMKYMDQKNILILNSYDPNLKWTRDTLDGLLSVLEEAPEKKRLHIEYMDTKNYPNKEDISYLTELYRHKYEGVRFDVIIVGDDNAFNFARKHRRAIFRNAPIVFCGVNYIAPEMLKQHEHTTGIVESFDLAGTLGLIRKLHPGVRDILVINDQTTTGEANKKRVLEIIPVFHGKLNFDFTEPMKMSELLQKVKTLPETTALLIMTFTKDRNNDVFTYTESIRLISESARVPIYSIWDFYLGYGIVGGVLTSGSHQGRAAGEKALRIIRGETPGEIPITVENKGFPMFDNTVMKKFGLTKNDLPPDSRIIRQDPNFYRRYKKLVWTQIGVLAVLLLSILLLMLRLKAYQQSKTALQREADTDEMTGAFNRRACMRILEERMRVCAEKGASLMVCYIDINNLKTVNDQFGHAEGDQLILKISEVIQKKVRQVDSLCRVGGDEFLLVLPDCPESVAREIWGRIEDEFSKINASGTLLYPVGASSGFACFDPDAPVSSEELIQKADEEMYLRKHAARSGFQWGA